jgi:hypothetical protein
VCRVIDESYFRDYAGSGAPYWRSWLLYSHPEDCVAWVREQPRSAVRSLWVLGAATGQVLRYFDRRLGFAPWGCEVSPWAWARIPPPYRRRVRCASMTTEVERWIERRRIFDLAYSNSLIYLSKEDLAAFLPRLALAARHLYFRSSVRGACCPDPHRKTLESWAWWERLFAESGFEHLPARKGKRRGYVWRSLRARR